MPDTSQPNTFLQRLIGAAALDTAIYEEVESDRTATMQAMAVVVLASVAAGIGSESFGNTSVPLIAIATAAALFGWAVWAVITLQVGTRILPGSQTQADLGQLLRTLGFASTPGLLRVLGVLPGVGWPVNIVTAIWMLASMVVAVRQALDYQSTARALAVCLIGWVLFVGVMYVVSMMAGSTVQ
jgi:hypothetical protein